MEVRFFRRLGIRTAKFFLKRTTNSLKKHPEKTAGFMVGMTGAASIAFIAACAHYHPYLSPTLKAGLAPAIGVGQAAKEVSTNTNINTPSKAVQFLFNASRYTADTFVTNFLNSSHSQQ